MKYVPFGNTALQVSTIGFGAWAIGGPANVHGVEIGWGPTNDVEATAAIQQAIAEGINFFDTADFYGLGHSESLVGKVIGNHPNAIIATKVGQKPGTSAAAPIQIDYSYSYIQLACEASLRRLQREQIDFYQLHVAKVEHLANGECVQALQALQQAGKIRYWGVSLNTFQPFPEAEWLLSNHLGHGVQLVLNLINQRARPLLPKLAAAGMGIIARMPYQFGLLTGKWHHLPSFATNDHRHARLNEMNVSGTMERLAPLQIIAEQKNLSLAQIALGFILAQPGINTVIPGMRHPAQVSANCLPPATFTAEELALISDWYEQNAAFFNQAFTL